MKAIQWNQCAVALLIGLVCGIPLGQWHVRECHGPWKKDGKGMKQRMMTHFSRELNLTAEQQPKVEAIFEASRSKMEALHEEVRPRFEALRCETQEEIRRLLTPEQEKKFEAMNAKMEKRWKHGKRHFRP